MRRILIVVAGGFAIWHLPAIGRVAVNVGGTNVSFAVSSVALALLTLWVASGVRR